jgi:hypothetical protein
MGDKKHGAKDEMSVTDSAISEARGWSEHLLGKAFRGPGDTIERAAHQVEQTYGVPASIIQRLRHRDVHDMLLSNWLVLKHAYDAACEDVERRADHQKFIAEQTGQNAANSRAFAAASLLDRTEGTED